MESHQLLKLQDVMEMTKISKSQIYQKIKENKFPQNIKCFRRGSRWVLAEIQAWIQLAKK